MTISPQEPQQQAPLPAMPSDYTGLEEFGVEDMVTPRISIEHREGLFKDSLTNTTFPTLHVIILGLVKQRILWPERMTPGDKPMCRSNDHKTGFVNLSLINAPADKQFPWHKSNFDPNQQAVDAEGRLALPCDGCELKEWGSHPDGKKPFCSEMFTLPVMYDPSGTGNWVPALISFIKTQLKPLRAYLSAFQRMGTPAFQVYTQIDLEVNTFGSNPFSVPRFTMGTQTDPNHWVEYATNSRSMAGFLRVPPRVESEQEAQPAPSANTWGQQPQQQAPADPWGQQPQQTIQGQVNQPVQQQPVAPPQQPVQQPQPVAAQAPPQQFQQPVAPPVQQPVQTIPEGYQPAQQPPFQQVPQQPVAPPPFQQQAPAPVQQAPQPAPVAPQPVAPPVEPQPVAQEPAPQAAAAPVTDPSGIVGGWAAQVGGAPQETAPQTPQPAPEQPQQPVAEQPPVQQAPQEQPQGAPQQGQPLPF